LVVENEGEQRWPLGKTQSSGAGIGGALEGDERLGQDDPFILDWIVEGVGEVANLEGDRN